ncbi:MAG: dockerin type I repeat-containing protein [Candidatus Zixiibacteriota bacterium]
MRKKLLIATILAAFFLTLSAGSVLAKQSAKDASSRQFIHKNLTGAEDLDLMSTGPAIPYFGTTQSPGHDMGITVYDYQHNGTMGRQAAHQLFTEYVHFTWMRRETETGDRYLRYNAWNLTAGAFAHGFGLTGGKQFGDLNGGYTTCDVTNSGSVVVSGHWGQSEDSYGVHADVDASAGLGIFAFGPAAPPPPTCENWNTGGNEANNQYVWPVVAWQDSAGLDIVHAVAVEFAAELISTMVYYRSVGGSDFNWPDCGTAIDSIHNVAPVVRVNHANPGELAIVWAKPAYYANDPNDPCGQLQWQNDIAYMKSFDYGNTWGSIVNVTDYTQGGTVLPDKLANGMAYTDLSAMYATDGKLHIVWNTALHDLTGSTPCEPEDQQSRLWHWDDGPSGCISIVYDAARPSNGINPGAFNLSATKMNISECLDTLLDVSRMYVSFTRFGALTDATGDTCIDNSDGYFSNGEIFLSGSADGGVTWGEAQNLTNTPTPDCTAGNCESDHWSSMAMYSVDSVHIQYINDKDAGGQVQGEGEPTQSPVMYLSVPCFTPATFCNIGYTPTSIGYPTWIAPNDGSTGCTGDITVTFDLELTNTGNEPTSYTVTSNATWLTPASAAGSLPAGCGNSESVQFTFGPIVDEGVYHTTMDVEACGGAISGVINVDLYVFCDFFVPENALLSTACWSVGVWNVPRAGLSTRSEKGNMWWFEDSSTFMYDEGVVITYANDTTNTSFSMFDGSDSKVEFRALGLLVTADSGSYEYAQGSFCTQDTAIIGTIQFYVPKHPDTCVIVERVEICNNTAASMTLHVGEGIDWDIPDGAGGSENQCSKDDMRQEVYQFGPSDADPEVNYYATVGICGGIAGAIVLQNDEWVYSNAGYHPAEIGGLLASLSSFTADNPDTAQDLNSFYAIKQNVTLAPGACYKFCKVKAGSKTGVVDLQALIDKGKEWIAANGLNCPGCGSVDCVPGDADGSGAVDIDDVVYEIAYIFTGGPAPVTAVCCGDADGSGGLDIDDVVYLIAYIFTGGPEPDPNACANWPG